MNTMINATILNYLQCLYPDPPPDAWVVCSAKTPQGFPSHWVRANALDQAANWIAGQSIQRDTYVGLGLRDPSCIPDPASRGTIAEVCALPGLWIECDHRAGTHAALTQYPTPDELQRFVSQLPGPPTLIINSSGGLHLYWLFKEVWLLDTPQEQQRAAILLERLQRTLQAWAAQDGWKIDSTHDLARVLRPAGTFNHKTGQPLDVTCQSSNGPRYDPSELEQADWMEDMAPTAIASTPMPGIAGQASGVFAAGELQPVVDGCGWLRHCWDEAARLPEPEWYAMLGIVGRCAHGEVLIHDWSKPHPGYTAAETAAKLAHALQHGPATCASIEATKGGTPYCQVCPVHGHIASPLVLQHPVQTTKPPPPTTVGGVPLAAKIQVTDFADMLERFYPVPQWLIPTLIPEGLTFFVGSPKSSKTYLAYSLALSMAYDASVSGKWLEHYDITLSGPVVYITLEDDESDSRLRVQELAPWLTTLPRDRLLFVHGFELPRFNEGLVDALEQEIILQYHPAMIVLDPISYLYSPVKKSGDQFQEVRDMLLPLRWLGKQHHCAIVGIDHRRKKSADDVDIFETTYGSNAKLAIADSLLMIVRDDAEITIHARVRKAMDQTLTLLFEFAKDGTARWHWKGATNGIVSQGNYGGLRTDVLALLERLKAPMNVKEILAYLNIPESAQTRNTLFQVLFRATKAGEVEKTTTGRYVWNAVP